MPEQSTVWNRRAGSRYPAIPDAFALLVSSGYSDTSASRTLGMLDGVYPVVIRNADLADLVVVRDVFRRSSLSNDGDRAQLLANPKLLEWSPPPAGQGRTRIAVVDDAIVGFATTTVGADCLELDDLFGDPDSMRHGVGRALILDATALARDRNVVSIEVTANERALRLLRASGVS